MFQDINDVLDEDVDTEMIVEDKGNGEKGGSKAETVSTARPDISAARQEVSTAEPKTPPTTATLCNDEDVTIVDTLGKSILQEPEPVKKTKKKDQDQIKRDAKVALKIQACLDEKAKTKRERQEEASKAALAEMYDEVQAQIDVDHKLAIRLTHEEQEKYTVEERFTHAQLKSRSFEEIKKLYIKEQKWVDAFVPIGSKEDEKRIGSRKKRATDDDKAIDYETLDVKSPIVDCESQLIGTNKAGSGSGHGCQETIGGAMAHIRSEGALIQSIDPPLSTGYTVRSGEDKMEHDIKLTDPIPQIPYDSPLSIGHTPGSDKGSMTLKELTDLCITLLQKVLDLENVKTAQ
nr:hypothetical protein [Tanacetum cinerariifolium]